MEPVARVDPPASEEADDRVQEVRGIILPDRTTIILTGPEPFADRVAYLTEDR